MFFFKWFLNLFSFLKTTTTTSTTTTKTSTKNSVKKSLHIGINNYPGTANDLKGCVNDARNWKKLMEEQYKFNETNILLNSKATVKNIKNRLKSMVSDSQPGDSLVFTFSGHGTSVKDTNEDETDGRDEALVLYDGLIIDDTIQKIMKTLPKGVNFTFISDSCHSGTVTRQFIYALNHQSIARYLPPENVIEDFALNMLPVKRGIYVPEKNMKEILIAGCMASEYSYDAVFNGKPEGAFSHYSIKILKENPKISYNDFYKKLRKLLPNQRYPQTPQLEGSESTKKALIFQ